jgi:hypothetical protein
MARAIDILANGVSSVLAKQKKKKKEREKKERKKG